LNSNTNNLASNSANILTKTDQAISAINNYKDTVQSVHNGIAVLMAKTNSLAAAFDTTVTTQLAATTNDLVTHLDTVQTGILS